MPNSLQESNPYHYKVSVIIPTYKPEDYIYECFESVCKQTLDSNGFEVIVIVNGCNEPYISNIRNYFSNKQNHVAVSIKQTDVPGVSNARNIGIECSQGEFLTFVDDDDIISDDYLEELLKVSSRDCVGCSNSYTFFNDIKEHNNNFLTEAYETCKGARFDFYQFRKFLSPPVAKLLHRAIINKERFPVNLSRSEDSVFCLKIARNIKDMKVASESCVYYIRKRQGSVTRRGRSLFQEISILFKIEWAYLKLWLRHPFSYNLKFVFSRFMAAIKNFVVYCKNNRQAKATK